MYQSLSIQKAGESIAKAIQEAVESYEAFGQQFAAADVEEAPTGLEWPQRKDYGAGDKFT